KNGGISFGIVKATDGLSFIDPRFDDNWTGMRRAQVIRGAYHFFRPQMDPVKQAEYYLMWVGDILHETDLPPVLDVEAYPDSNRKAFLAIPLQQRINRVLAWVTTVWDKTGREPIIYTNWSTWRDILGDTDLFTQFPLWIAHYDVTQPLVPAKNWGGQGWTIWQQSANAAVPGVNGGKPPCDLNVYKDTPAVLNSWLGITTPRKAPIHASNEEVLAGIKAAAKELGKGYKNWLERIGITYLEKPESPPNRPYDGPAISDFPLRPETKKKIREAIKIVQGRIEAPPYGDISNQQIMDVFFEAGKILGTPGWELIKLAGQEHLAEKPGVVYRGPEFEKMSGLGVGQVAALYEALEKELNPLPPIKEEEITPQGPAAPYPGMHNQDMINVFYQAANILGLQGWNLIAKAGLTNLVDDREAVYTGPKIEKMTGLSELEKTRITQVMGINTSFSGGEYPYRGLVNQDMINVFYKAASHVGESGWSWIEQEGLEYIGQSRVIRYELYKGPSLENMTTLNVQQRMYLHNELEDLRNN
ncbi:MAG: GH25 family lysozyme, partial [Anaerolineae bacterium]|nr:GH25 family lysozyme [Anaerolineae bacterium]